MMNKHKISTVVLITLILIGTAGAVIVNIDGSNFVPLSWFNTNKTAWDAVNTTVNFYTGNASNLTSGRAPNSTLPASAMNYSTSRYKLISTTRDVSLTGTQAITGAGFKPTYMTITANIVATSAMSLGNYDGTTQFSVNDLYQTVANTWDRETAYCVFLTTGNGVFARGSCTSINDDGLTITWDKVGSPTGTANIAITFYR